MVAIFVHHKNKKAMARDTKKYAIFQFVNPKHVIMGGVDANGMPWKLRNVPLRDVRLDDKDVASAPKYNRIAISGAESREFKIGKQDTTLLQLLRDQPYVKSSLKSAGLKQPDTPSVVEYEPEVVSKEKQREFELMREIDSYASKAKTDEFLPYLVDYFNIPGEDENMRLSDAFKKIGNYQNNTKISPEKALTELKTIFKLTKAGKLSFTPEAEIRIAIRRGEARGIITRGRNQHFYFSGKALGRTLNEMEGYFLENPDERGQLFDQVNLAK